MHCRRAEERIQSLLDARLAIAADEALSQHLAECPACQELASTYERIARAFLQPRRIVWRTLSRAELSSTPAGSHWSRYPVPAALAAALAGVALWISQGPEPGGRQLAQVNRATVERSAATPNEQAGAIDAAAPSREPAAVSTSITNLLALAPVSLLNFDELTPTTRQWVEPVSGGFRPVTRSMEAAIGVMRDTVLGPEPAARS